MRVVVPPETRAALEHVVRAPTEAALVWRPNNSIALVHIDDHLWDLQQPISSGCIFCPVVVAGQLLTVQCLLSHARRCIWAATVLM